MKHEIKFPERTITYELQYKQVKNINLRIRRDGSVFVSASRLVPKSAIDAFLLSKKDFILGALNARDAQNSAPLSPYFAESEIKSVILAICRDVYPYFQARGIPYPQIKFRKMVSRWGSCHSTKGIVTFNLNLMFAPEACIRYVVLHEFCHFLQANHAPKFYEELAKVCPDWKEQKRRLKEVKIP